MLALAWVATGCGHVGYYTQAATGQWRIWARQRPVEKLLVESRTDPALRRQLELASRLRRFAKEELHLDPGGSYLRYADLGRPYVSWTVTAAPAFSLEPKEWWYPVVGSLAYRGYFQEKAAHTLANRLRSEEWDVAVGGVTAYSTLGWFSDPLLNTFIHDPEAMLADLLFHELAHRRLFVPGDTDFNEAFATAVAAEGVRRWLMATGNTELAARVQSLHDRDSAVREVLLAGRERLAVLYRNLDGSASPQADKERELERIRTELKTLGEQWNDPGLVEPWLREPLNNARLNDVATYHELVPRFEALLRDCGGDLEAWYRRVEEIGNLDLAERRNALPSAEAQLSAR